jgi:hypothetical protein
MSQAGVADALGCRVAKVSMMEGGQRTVQESDLGMLFDLFDVPEADHESWLAATRYSREKGWWERDGRDVLPDWLMRYIGLEQGAMTLRSYQPGVVPALLQTEAYAAALVRQSHPVSEGMVDRRVAHGVRRREVLDHDTDPLKMSAIIDESALRRVVGSRTIVLEQLEHLAQVADEKANVTVRVVPLDRGGAFAANLGAFAILQLPWGPLVYLEKRTAGVALESLAETDAYALLFLQLHELALSPADSIDLIKRTRDLHSEHVDKAKA